MSALVAEKSIRCQNRRLHSWNILPRASSEISPTSTLTFTHPRLNNTSAKQWLFRILGFNFDSRISPLIHVYIAALFGAIRYLKYKMT